MSLTLKPTLQIKNLNVGYDRLLIQNLNLDLNLGERLIIYGANGTGKSTLLHSLLRPAFQAKHQVEWNIPQDQILLLQQQSSFHSQTPDSVENYLLNILLYKKPLTNPSKLDLQKVHGIQEKLNLPNMPLKNLSGGQRQKLKMARGFLLETKALLLDEPFNAIDQTSTTEIMNWLQESQPHMVQLLVLHDYEQIERLKARVLWIQQDSWELMDFEDWFHKVDRRFHSWMHTVQAPTCATAHVSKPNLANLKSLTGPQADHETLK